MVKRFQYWIVSIATVLFLTITSSVKALEVEVFPPNPQLGDTISVMIENENSNSPPVVTVGDRTYPVFPLGDRFRAFVPTSPLDSPGKLTVKIEGRKTTRNIGVWLKNRTFPIQRIWLPANKSSSATQLELDRVSEFKKLVTPKKYWNGSLAKPSTARISTIYGVRRYYNGVFANNYYHKGVDYAGYSGSPILAPAAGEIRLIGKEAEGFRVHGNVVGIDHGQGVLSLFLHMRDIVVKEGDVVRSGQRIGTVGSTGASTGPHLHWGFYVNGVAVDPVPWRFGNID